MPRLSALTPDTAVGVSRDLLADLVSRHGSIGDMVATMAHSPAVLGGYLQLSQAMGRAELDRRISERISVALQVQQGCRLCLDAHVDAARTLGVDEDEIERARACCIRGARPPPAGAVPGRMDPEGTRHATVRHP
ncbi:carboxymuconolactone decarboxylase family protein [Kitasatospora griseola]|uniref:carboxymuconolactone decarboxylase family protein n=1 Tax=Kitasatospora griseola TaxID=2064 RepID=UPI00385608FF